MRSPGSVASLALLTCAAWADPAHAATITGTISATRVPPSTPAAITHDRHACGQRGLVWSSTVSADDRGRVAGAIVYLTPRVALEALTRGLRRTKRPLVIDQQDCAFVPATGALSVGAELRVRSSDPVFHNVHVRRADGSTAANVSTPLGGTEVVALVAAAPGPLTLSCDAGHVWMRADVLVLEHELFDRTRRGGGFRIEGVPAGAWWLVAWHPVLGERRAPVDVPNNAEVLARSLAY